MDADYYPPNMTICLLVKRVARVLILYDYETFAHILSTSIGETFGGNVAISKNNMDNCRVNHDNLTITQHFEK